MATSGAGVQQGIEDSSIDYYDILVIGRTGMGKSTTADKLLIANLTNRNYLGAEYSEPAVDEERILADDLTIWLISDEIEKAKKRLKDLIMCRGLENPHKEINTTHTVASPVTRNCELISNETTKVRVLDVPGFFGEDAGETSETSQSVSDHSLPRSISKAQNMAVTDLGIMRKILHIQSAMKMEFKRILYFLPDKGPLVRGSGNLQVELGSMVHYFGMSIFDCMVLIATQPANVYKFVQPGTDPFDEDDMKKTRENFQVALRHVLPETEPLPKPPIIFASMNDSCETIYKKIDSATVAKKVVKLMFDSETCARCGIKTKILKKNEKVACYFGQNESSTIPYEESTCHPIFIPKYSKVTKILGGIAHLLTFRVFMGKWPSFKNMDEVCIDCKRAPGSRGCRRVGSDFVHGKESIKVEHTNDEDEPIVVVMEEAEVQAPRDEDNPTPPNETQEQNHTAKHLIVAMEPPQRQIDVEGACYDGVPDQKG